MSDLAQLLGGRRVALIGSGDALQRVDDACVDAGAATAQAAIGDGDFAATFDSIAQRLGGNADLLVVAVPAMTVAGSAEAVMLAEWRTSLSEPIDASFLHIAEFARRLIADAGHGAILLLMPGTESAPGRVAALTGLGALDNLVKTLAVEWGRDGIRTNAIASHVVENFAGASDSQKASLGAFSAYLLSDYASYATGGIIGIDETGMR